MVEKATLFGIAYEDIVSGQRVEINPETMAVRVANQVRAWVDGRDSTQSVDVEAELRREWWGNHGHAGLYGDDGEMQCALCPADFKRQPLDVLKGIVWVARIQRAEEN